MFSKTFDDHLKHVSEILDRIIKAKLKLRPDKCVFAADQVNYLGFVITKDGVRPDDDKVKAISEMKFPKSANQLIQNGVLMVKENSSKRIVVPKKVLPVLFSFHHDLPLAGHRDYEKTLNSLKSRYFWFNMAKDTKAYCSTCHLCQTKKYSNRVNRAPLKPIVVNTPWSLIGLDVSGPLKRTVNGNSYVLVAVDYFTKYCVAKAVPDFTAETTAKFIFEEIICKLGSQESSGKDVSI